MICGKEESRLIQHKKKCVIKMQFTRTSNKPKIDPQTQQIHQLLKQLYQLNQDFIQKKQVQGKYYELENQFMQLVKKINQINELQTKAKMEIIQLGNNNLNGYGVLKSLSDQLANLHQQLYQQKEIQKQISKKIQKLKCHNKQTYNQLQNLRSQHLPFTNLQPSLMSLQSEFNYLNQIISQQTYKLFILGLQSGLMNTNNNKIIFTALGITVENVVWSQKQWMRLLPAAVIVGRDKYRLGSVYGPDQNLQEYLQKIIKLSLYPNLVFMMQRISFCSSYLLNLLQPGLLIRSKEDKATIILILINVRIDGIIQKIQQWKNQIILVQSISNKGTYYQFTMLMEAIQYKKKLILINIPAIKQAVTVLQRKRRSHFLDQICKGQRRVLVFCKMPLMLQELQVQSHVRLLQLLKR